MRLALTVVSPATRFWADVVIDADPATPVADVAAELERMAYGAHSSRDEGARGRTAGPGGLGAGPGGRVLRFPGPRPRGSLAVAAPGVPGSLAGYATVPRPAEPIPLYLDFQQIGPQLTLASSPIRNGSVVSLGDPSGCLAPEPTGLVEIRVA